MKHAVQQTGNVRQEPFFHVGILVPDLSEAIGRFGQVLGLTFAEPIRWPIPRLDESGRSREWEVYVTYSKQGPPYLELIEAAGDGVYSTECGYGLHHIGAWYDDPAKTIEHLARQGVGAQATMWDGETSLGAYFDPADLYGVRFEASPAIIRDGRRQWVEGTRSSR